MGFMVTLDLTVEFYGFGVVMEGGGHMGVVRGA